MKDVVLFDLGNTLVECWQRPEFPGILEHAIGEVSDYLCQQDRLCVPPEEVWRRVQEENHESPDHRVRPLERRLARIFAVDPSDAMLEGMCRRFMEPMFSRARLYPDTIRVLDELSARGFTSAIVSNAPWGSPAVLWREELASLGLCGYAEVAVFCGDVGWRKPARQIYEYTLEQLHARPEQCLFVGDDPRWDLVGPRAMGIDAILIDRVGTSENSEEQPMRALYELWERLTK